MMETDERIMNEGVRRTDVGTRESKDDLEDDENLENDDSGGRGRGDNDVGAMESKDELEDDGNIENDDSGGRGQGDNEIIVLGGAKRKRMEDGLGS